MTKSRNSRADFGGAMLAAAAAEGDDDERQRSVTRCMRSRAQEPELHRYELEETSRSDEKALLASIGHCLK